MKKPSLSVCFGIMNRFRYKHKGEDHPLFERTFPQLLQACQHYGNANICMVDMASNDIEPISWAMDQGRKYKVPVYYVKAQRRKIYNIGFTKNLAASLTISEYVAFVDVDMLIPTNYFDIGIKILKEKKCAWFPVYDRESSPGGKLYRGNGRGNCMMERKAWEETRWAELDKWGGEDCIFCNRLIKKGWEQDRTFPEGLIHIWHPLSSEKQETDKEKIGI